MKGAPGLALFVYLFPALVNEVTGGVYVVKNNDNRLVG